MFCLLYFVAPSFKRYHLSLFQFPATSATTKLTTITQLHRVCTCLPAWRIMVVHYFPKLKEVVTSTAHLSYHSKLHKSNVSSLQDSSQASILRNSAHRPPSSPVFYGTTTTVMTSKAFDVRSVADVSKRSSVSTMSSQVSQVKMAFARPSSLDYDHVSQNLDPEKGRPGASKLDHQREQCAPDEVISVGTASLAAHHAADVYQVSRIFETEIRGSHQTSVEPLGHGHDQPLHPAESDDLSEGVQYRWSRYSLFEHYARVELGDTVGEGTYSEMYPHSDGPKLANGEGQ